MVKSVSVAGDGSVDVGIYLTTQGCPLRDRITKDVTAAVAKVPGVTGVRVDLDVMSDEQRQQLRTTLQGGQR
jgi:ATP-binding protein involved in chromosome partitioning